MSRHQLSDCLASKLASLRIHANHHKKRNSFQSPFIVVTSQALGLLPSSISPQFEWKRRSTNGLNSRRPFNLSRSSWTRCMSTNSFLPSKLLEESPLSALDTFPRRHIGPSDSDIDSMCSTVGVLNLKELISKTIPEGIMTKESLEESLGPGLSESQLLTHMSQLADMNHVYKNYIGMGYTSTLVPPVILRNILESPGWYTQYTPYQAEISQGRLESLLNYQTLVTDLTGLPIANASLLDEGTAASESMLMCFASYQRKKDVFLIDKDCHPQTISCVQSRAEPLNIKVVVGSWSNFDFDEYKGKVMGVLIQVRSETHSF